MSKRKSSSTLNRRRKRYKPNVRDDMDTSIIDDISNNMGYTNNDFVSLYRILYPFQKRGVKFAISKEGRCIIGDEMGLGKTYQAITIALYYIISDRYFERGKRILIVVPPSLITQWYEELIKLIPKLKGYDGFVKRITKGSMEMDGVLIDILSYGLCAKVERKKIIETKKYSMIIVDEFQKLKSKKSQTTKTLTNAIRHTERCILLSGTPVMNRTWELFSPLQCLNQNELLESTAREYCNNKMIPYPEHEKTFVNWTCFTDRYCDANTRSRFGRNVNGSSNTEELNHVLKSVMIRRLKKDVLDDLPKKIRHRVYIEVNKRGRNKIQKGLANIKGLYNKTSGNTLREKLAQMYQHQRAIMELYRLNAEVKIGPSCDYIKFYLGNHMEDNGKLLIFGHHRTLLDEIESTVNKWAVKEGIQSIRIDGSVPSSKRGELVAEFQEDPNVRIAILSITAAGVGLTLTAANVAIFAEMYWTPASILQAEDRCHRISQTKTCQIKYLIGKDTYDEKMWRMLNRKSTIINKLLDGGSTEKMFGTNDYETWININSTQSETEEDSIEDSLEEIEIPEINGGDRQSPLTRAMVSNFVMSILDEDELL